MNKKEPQVKYIKINNKSTELRLKNDGYVRPEKTATELLTPEEIELRLRNYEQVDINEIEKLSNPTRIQYFEITTNDDGEDIYRYRQGGILIINKYPDYLVLEGKNSKTFCVQIKKHVFYKEKDYDKLKKEYEDIIIKKNRIIEEQKYIIEQFQKKSKTKQ
jgi:hypothetical protein